MFRKFRVIVLWINFKCEIQHTLCLCKWAFTLSCINYHIPCMFKLSIKPLKQESLFYFIKMWWNVKHLPNAQMEIRITQCIWSWSVGRRRLQGLWCHFRSSSWISCIMSICTFGHMIDDVTFGDMMQITWLHIYGFCITTQNLSNQEKASWCNSLKQYDEVYVGVRDICDSNYFKINHKCLRITWITISFGSPPKSNGPSLGFPKGHLWLKMPKIWQVVLTLSLSKFKRLKSDM